MIAANRPKTFVDTPLGANACRSDWSKVVEAEFGDQPNFGHPRTAEVHRSETIHRPLPPNQSHRHTTVVAASQ